MKVKSEGKLVDVEPIKEGDLEPTESDDSVDREKHNEEEPDVKHSEINS